MTLENAYKGAREKQREASSVHDVNYGNTSRNVCIENNPGRRRTKNAVMLLLGGGDAAGRPEFAIVSMSHYLKIQ